MKPTIRVLIADDEGKVIETLTCILQLADTDYEFSIAKVINEHEVLNKIEEFSPNVVLLDNWFKDRESGIKELLPEITGKYSKVKVIIITSKRGGKIDQIMDATGWGISNFIDKQTMTDDDLIESVIKAYNESINQEGAV